MLERFPVLSIFLLCVAVVAFGLLAVWLWLTVGLITATLLIIAAVLVIPVVYRMLPWSHRGQ